MDSFPWLGAEECLFVRANTKCIPLYKVCEANNKQYVCLLHISPSSSLSINGEMDSIRKSVIKDNEK